MTPPHACQIPPLGAQPEGRRAAAAWRSRLADLEHWLSEPAPPGVVGFPGRGDGVPARLLGEHRAALLAAVADSRARLARPAAAVEPSAGPGPDGE